VQIKNDHLIAEFGAMRSAAQKVSVFGPSPKKKAPCTSTYEIDVGERIFQQLVCSDTDRSPIIVRVRPKAGMRSLGVPLDNVLSHCLRLHGEVPERSNGAVSKTVVPLAGDRGFESLPLRSIKTDVLCVPAR
jgi:hypothetical protein